MRCNELSSGHVTPGLMASFQAFGDNYAMRNKHHFIKEWRASKGLSLRKLADRLVTDAFDPVISYASLSRIEKGEQPYTQETLEAIAEALGTSPASLLIFDPSRDDGLLSLWDRIPVNERRKAFEVLAAFAKAS